MRSRFVIIALATGLGILLLSIATGCPSADGEPSAMSPSLASSTPTASSTSWLILPDLPATATQADVGAEIYRLVCQDCHGNHGQGLTDDWRAEWAPEHQNCWQARCHAANHPPEGFKLPHYVPPVMGPTALSGFTTAIDLYEFIHKNMPWHNPGSLQEAEYWQLTAFLIRENKLAPPTTPLDQEQAATLLLHSTRSDTPLNLSEHAGSRCRRS